MLLHPPPGPRPDPLRVVKVHFLLKDKSISPFLLGLCHNVFLQVTRSSI